RPTKISHVVLNSARTEDQIPFFVDVLGFRLSDSTQLMELLRCSADHHSVAIVRNNGPSLNHVAYELPHIDRLMPGRGSVQQRSDDIERRSGLCAPRSTVYCYSTDPTGLAAESTPELAQLDEATHAPQEAGYWQKMIPMQDPGGTAGPPSNRIRAA